MIAPKQPVCSHCGSTYIYADAYAEWDADKQEWVLLTTFDDYHCSDCAGPASVVWVEVTSESKSE